MRVARTFEERSLSETWLAACEHLMRRDGHDANVSLVISPSAVEDPRVTAILEAEIREMHLGRASWVRRVADSIFPLGSYRRAEGDFPGDARRHLYEMQGLRREFLRSGGIKPSYFDRFISWPIASGRQSGAYNQLENNVIVPLARAKDNCNCIELATVPLGGPCDLRVHEPSRDNKPIGGPCLSHISFTLFKRTLTMTAIYRNHYYITKAYGNLVGLRDLQRFVCDETGYEVGELLCVSSHADLYESPRFSKGRVEAMLARCREALRAGEPTNALGAV